MSTLAKRNGISGKWKGKIAEVGLFPGQIRWSVGEYLPDCHVSGALSFLTLDCVCCRECWSHPGFAVFLFEEKG